MKRRAFENFGYDPSNHKADRMSVFSGIALLMVVFVTLLVG